MEKKPDRSQTTVQPLKPVEFLLLAILQREPMHGYGIVGEIEQRSAGRIRVRPGDLYRVIYRLNARGLVATADERHVDSADDRRNYYRITAKGLEELRSEASYLREVAGQVITEEAAH